MFKYLMFCVIGVSPLMAQDRFINQIDLFMYYYDRLESDDPYIHGVLSGLLLAKEAYLDLGCIAKVEPIASENACCVDGDTIIENNW